MDFAVPADLQAYLDELDAFIAAEIKPLEDADDNIRFFDHRREHARTDWDNQGLPREEWEGLLRQATRKADAAGHWRFAAPKKYGGQDGSNLWMAVIREHLGLEPDSSLPAAVAAANERAGLAAEGGLLQQVDRLMALLFDGST